MGKRIIALVLAAVAGMSPLAAPAAAFTGGFVGMGGEANANTRHGVAGGGGLSLGLELSRYWSFGMKAAFSGGGGVLALEPAALARLSIPAGSTAFFAQAETGAAVLFEDGKAYPAFLGGLALGWRFNLGRAFYMEPYFRGGYPFAWGAGMCLGVRFQTVSAALYR